MIRFTPLLVLLTLSSVTSFLGYAPLKLPPGHRVPVYSLKGGVQQERIITHVYKQKSPLTATVLSCKKISHHLSRDTYHIVIDHEGKMPNVEGQSVGVVPPVNVPSGVEFKNRLYSVANCREGELLDKKTLSFCVSKVATSTADRQQNEEHEGVCSSYLCGLKPGDQVSLTGPMGKVILLDQDCHEKHLIWVATGTGIAPFRSFWRRLFPVNKQTSFKGSVLLIFGIGQKGIYAEELETLQEKYQNFQVEYALSCLKNERGHRLHVQDKLYEKRELVLNNLLHNNASIYFCGLRGMMPDIKEIIMKECSRQKLDGKEIVSQLKKEGRWKVEVY